MTLLLTLDDGSLHRKLADAVEVAREAVLAEAPADQVGEHVGVEREDAVSASHLFEASVPGYGGWRWSVTVAVAGPDEPVTVSELVLQPGPEALVAPAWVPWEQRVRAGDLGVGDLFPADKDDPRLSPAYLQSDDPAVEEAAMEVGLGRVHVLSRYGRLDAAARWHSGEFGPRSDMARSAPATCGTCGFFVPLAGSLRGSFGACTNDIAPADGHVVDVAYGCGAHSEVRVEVTSSVPVAELVYDDSLIDFTPAPEPAPEPSAVADPAVVEEAAAAAAEETAEVAVVEPETAAEVAVEEAAEAAADVASDEVERVAEDPVEGADVVESGAEEPVASVDTAQPVAEEPVADVAEASAAGTAVDVVVEAVAPEAAEEGTAPEQGDADGSDVLR
ncbi:DUF3027 domain-containing protein [Amycolatopsis sp. AA4]|uniref:DUF3027 domain-containing protein n=1 Tax=Actinomycetes TaxID=1760 RepID=UPI0001B55681|nr:MULTISPECIES: DUF3027 domain-containing protein [Actinomycetes]ATY15057.1 DUF3027 domain-containing protein [Amycolatopsis sp. AA4]EFL11259.1 conserved hypothetical protein [Streptomyces sp. AA4]